MIRHIVLLALMLLLSLSGSALAAEQGSGTIKGQVVNRTTSGSSVADQDLTLRTYLNDAEVGVTTTKTDADGRFVFGGLSTESGYRYDVVLTFQEAEYYSEWLSFDEGETTKSAEVIVYDSTTSDEAIKVTIAHTFIYVEQGSLWVEEVFVFSNESDRAYIGSKEVTADGTKETLRFPLPKEATEFQITLGLMECCIIGSEEGFVDTMPVLPGISEVGYSYRVNYNSGAYTLSRNMNYPTTRYDLLFQGETIGVTSDQLVVEEPMQIEGTQFNHLSGSDFAPGDIVAVQLSGLPQTNNQEGAIIWVTLTLVALVGGFVFVYLLRKKRLQPVSPEDSPEQREQRLLIELAQLDDDFEDGKIDEEIYRRLRAERKSQLVALMQKSKGGRVNR